MQRHAACIDEDLRLGEPQVRCRGDGRLEMSPLSAPSPAMTPVARRLDGGFRNALAPEDEIIRRPPRPKAPVSLRQKTAENRA
jgi:hypothetical protein